MNTLKTGYDNLAALIEFQDRYFQETGKYKEIAPTTKLAHIANFKSCTDNCTPCEYAVKTAVHNFTATAKCVGKNGTENYKGYIRVKPGEHSGIDGYYEKCKAEGIFAGNRSLVNTIGPCFEQEDDFMFIASGSNKRLVIETFPRDVEVNINGTAIGSTSESHNATTSSYGSLFVSDPIYGTNLVTLSKAGYEPIKFSVDWDSYTYIATVVLKTTKRN